MEEARRRLEWKEEEEEAKQEYFRVIAEEEKNGYIRLTVAELIKKRSAEELKKKEKLDNLKKLKKEEEVTKEKKEGDKEIDEPIKLSQETRRYGPICGPTSSSC